MMALIRIESVIVFPAHLGTGDIVVMRDGTRYNLRDKYLSIKSREDLDECIKDGRLILVEGDNV